MHHLKGVDFPAKRQDLLNLAKKNHANQEVLDVIEKMPARVAHRDGSKKFGPQRPRCRPVTPHRRLDGGSARLRQTLGGRSGRLLTHISYTTPRGTTNAAWESSFK
jgi:uncharacterized protein DUF2795